MLPGIKDEVNSIFSLVSILLLFDKESPVGEKISDNYYTALEISLHLYQNKLLPTGRVPHWQ